jgi:histidinol-phosphate aminotransferase
MPHFSRRFFLHVSAAASAGAALHFMNEPMLAAAARRHQPHPAGSVAIDANENPLGPCQAARDAMAEILPHGGRYSDELTDELVKTFAQMERLNPDYVTATVGSTPPLAVSVLACTSPQRPYVTADPGFELGMNMASNNGVRVVKVPLTKAYAHDVKAMLAAGPDAGVFYICNPNNPTGTLTPRADIEYLVENKPKDSVVVIDEAYIHFAEIPSSLDLAKSRNDVIVLRTFSKVYGMAGIRCGFIVAHPDLKDKVLEHGAHNFMPITGVVAATASLKDSTLVAERRRINSTIRQQTFQWMDRNGFTYIPSDSNCFMVDVKRAGQDFREAMAKENVFIGRVWPIMPTWVRVTVGTQDEMAKFQTAFQKVIKRA